MFGIAAAILFGVAFLENGAGGTHGVWTSPTSLMLAGLTCLAVHVLSPIWPKR